MSRHVEPPCGVRMGPLATAADSCMKQQGGTKARTRHALLLHQELVSRGTGDCNTGPAGCATIDRVLKEVYFVKISSYLRPRSNGNNRPGARTLMGDP